MSELAPKTKRPVGQKFSKKSKKYWRKGGEVEHLEDFLSESSAQKKVVGVVHELPDDELFVVDRTPAIHAEIPKFTKRQQAALDKISNSLNELEPPTFPKAKAPSRKSLRKKATVIPTEVAVKKSKNLKEYDVWEKDFKPKLTLEHKEAEIAYLKYTKQTLPDAPKTVLKKTSLLRAVVLPDAGASYNPTAEDYEKYVNDLVVDEKKTIERERQFKESLHPPGLKMVTYKEKQLELCQGLYVHPDYKSTLSDDEEAEKPEDKVTVEVKPKTKRQKKTVARVKKEERERLQKKARESAQHDVFKAKKYTKELIAAEAQAKKDKFERKRASFLKKFTERQKLGRGQFEEEETPFLLKEELPQSLRQLKVQGSVLTDRVKSLQRRNMLPIGDKRNVRKLKERLKVKRVEGRESREIVKGTKLVR